MFVLKDGKYYIENDFMNTFFQNDISTIEEVEEAYENDDYGDKFSENEVYKFNLKPDVVDNKIKFQVKEIEPEESQIDRIEIIKVIHDKDTIAFSAEPQNGTVSTSAAAPVLQGNGSHPVVRIWLEWTFRKKC